MYLCRGGKPKTGSPPKTGMRFKLRAVIVSKNVCVQSGAPAAGQSRAVGAFPWRTRVHGKTKIKFFAIFTKKNQVTLLLNTRKWSTICSY